MQSMATESSMICDGHFELSSGKAQLRINVLSASLLGLSKKALQLSKGIKVAAGDIFPYRKPRGCYGIYIFEAGLSQFHAESLKGNIQIFLTCENQKVFIGSLSSSHPRMQLDLMMPGDFELSHTGLRKAICFNAYEFKTIYKKVLLRTDKELWVKIVKPFEEPTIDPFVGKKKYHLLKVFSTTNGRENIDLIVRHNEKHEKIGALSFRDAPFVCDFEYDSEFSLSHTSKTSDVVFYGYTIPYEHYCTSFVLKEIPGVKNYKLNHLPPKRPDDPEYSAYKRVTARKTAREEDKRARAEGVDPGRDGPRHPPVKLTIVTLVPSPFILV